jgi:hypothetical protein
MPGVFAAGAARMCGTTARDVASILIKLGTVVPLAAMLIPVAIAFTLPGYSSIEQHISAVALLDHPIAAIQRAAAIANGVAVLAFGVGLVLAAPRRFWFTALATTAVAAAMISNGVVVMGSPLHGLYGLGLFMALVPALFAAELPPEWRARRLARLSMACAVFNLVYLWLLFSGLDPAAVRGLTQRIAIVVTWGWYAVAGSAVLKQLAVRPA